MSWELVMPSIAVVKVASSTEARSERPLPALPLQRTSTARRGARR